MAEAPQLPELLLEPLTRSLRGHRQQRLHTETTEQNIEKIRLQPKKLVKGIILITSNTGTRYL